ncbi:MAG: DNA polymerase/3'-5' exonuclease PolX [Acidobacteria bacterium]|nr:DNA polymerase/3'-5' exonuclease PolX [Acidobacteriota bacterium]
MPRTNERLEALLSEWADLLEISGADSFRVRAYQKAARAAGGHSRDVGDLGEKELRQIPSIGAHMAARIREFVETGTMHDLEELRELVPAGLRELTRIPGLGPKKAVLVNRELGVASIPDLLDAIEHQRLRAVKGLGAKTEENLLRGIRNLREHGGRMTLDVALRVAEDVIEELRGRAAVEEVAYAGSLRRMQDTIGDIDLLVASTTAPEVTEAFVGLPGVQSVVARGDTKSSVLTAKGLQVDLRVVAPEVWGAALQYFTGSKAHNVKTRAIAVKKGLKLSEYGLFEVESGRRIASRTEEEVYAALGLPWILPTMREDAGEVEAALRGDLPDLVSLGDLRGDLHGHTDSTDGVATLEEMLGAAAARGYAYYAVTDHAEKLHMSGMKRETVLEQRDRIRSLQGRFPTMAILHGCELNIDRDGGLDYPDEFLAGFDFLVASIHSRFNLPRDEMTRRLLRAIENPFVNVIGHPTTRMIGRRPEVDVDLEAVLSAAARTGTALEVNCHPDRLDLRDEHVRWAVERGAAIAISTDAHAPTHLENMRFGVATAQRGWLTKARTLNARSLRDVREFVARKRGK